MTLPPATAATAPHAAMSGRQQVGAALATFLIIAAGSLCFCAKGIFIKLGYRLGLDTVTVLALRNLLALPFFIAGLAWSEWRAREAGAGPLSRSDLIRVLGLGFIGYYLSSLVNFLGLQHISVGLERMILFTYPSLVMMGSAVWLGQKLRAPAVAALALAYSGIALGFWSEWRVGGQGNVLLGSSLVFASAVTYAAFTMVSGQMIQRLGATRLMSWVLVISALMVLAHYSATHSWSALAAQPAAAWKLGLAIAMLGTVLPSYLFGWGLKRAGATTSSVIGMVGPVGTVVLAAWILAEPVTALQISGLALTLIGGLSISLLKTRPTPEPRPRP
ncbi:MAG: DMT family transporter [Verrucomicrobiales bacterium]